MSSPLANLDLSSAGAANEPPAGQTQAHADLLSTRTADRLEQLRALPEVQAQIAVMARQREAELATDREHTPQWIAQRRQEIRADAQKALDDSEAAAAEALEEVRSQARAANVRKPANATEELLLETKLANHWASMRQLLESAAMQSDPLGALELVTERAATDPARIEAIRRFSDDWIAARFTDPRTRERVTEALHVALERAEAPHLTPLQQRARAILAETERGVGRLQQNSAAVRRELATGGQTLTGALARWEGDNVIYLSDRGQPLPAELVGVTFGPRARAWAHSAQRGYPRLTGVGTSDEQRAADFRARLGMKIAE